ncbi:medium-chain acyl-[acyl-carrier-protein] hydrolase [Micromonospora pisi]|uniref:Medium-chain acyl-[acyl-carrier-protein] hydrolase n=1 Tax=Micromonospora pisi TaxID=589240 RepID=A0A495JQH8_9ACTN|nr:alpha/beta fold hydrolase [Micromonospora pisi]RKR91091.1 medium-chain acyl-[acyl-carrier-protein] hydrolase [Micromonospora pisi]
MDIRSLPWESADARRDGPERAAVLSLFCLPHAGGSGATYGGWRGLLGPRFQPVAVEFPGRGRRMREAPYTSAADLVEWLLAEHLEQMRAGPFAVFGHSMGGLLAFQLTYELVRRGLPRPRRLFISAALPPTCLRRGSLYTLPDDQLVRALHRLNGTSAEVLAHPELIDLMLPVVRADLRIAETWCFRPTVALDVPVSLLGGRWDPLVPPDTLDNWRIHLSGEVVARIYPGDHFYFRPDAAPLLTDLREDLRKGLPGAPP